MPNYAEFESIDSDLFIDEIFVPPHIRLRRGNHISNEYDFGINLILIN